MKRYPLHTAAFEDLTENGRIDYGIEIPWAEFEKASGAKRLTEKDHGWEFRQIYLKFCELLMDEGFKASTRGQNEIGFRILQREEMADCVLTEAHRQADKNLKNSIMLSAVPHREMDDLEVKKIENAAVKAAYVGGIMKRTLALRKLPATPEMARRQAQKLDLKDDGKKGRRGDK